MAAASGGNHGLATARAAQLAGVSATIFVPETISPEKVGKLAQWGAAVKLVGTVWDESNVAALDFAATTGAAYFHPFGDAAVLFSVSVTFVPLRRRSAPSVTTLSPTESPD